MSTEKRSYPRRLIEVDLPIKRISAHARREKSIRHGHISTLHIWWARRPLAACRAVLCASLWIDPADPLCPQEFRDKACEVMNQFALNVRENRALHDSCAEESQSRWLSLAKTPLDIHNNEHHLNVLRFTLLDFIADFANWDNSTNEEYLNTARILTQAAHEALGGEKGSRPLVVDPFAGGGSIPLEALRVGADAFASDLNPVAVLLNKVVLEYIPKYGKQLAEEVRKWGLWIKEQAEKELAEFYPKDPDGSTPIAYLWARTITCEGPGCGAEVPLMRSLWLAKKGNKSVALKIIPNPKEKRVDFEIMKEVKAKDVGDGTVKRGSAMCPCCGYTTPVASVRKQLKVRHGGANDARLLAVRQDDLKTNQRSFRLPSDIDIEGNHKAVQKLKYFEDSDLIPNEETPKGGGSGAGRAFSQRNYGMDLFKDLFSPRQMLSLITFLKLVKSSRIEMEKLTDDNRLINATITCLGLILNRLADFNTSLCMLNSTGGRGVVHTFGRQALPIVWDYLETNPFNEAGANWEAGINAFESTITNESILMNTGTSNMASSHLLNLPDGIVNAFCTDPPYYDAVPYADLSDFFYVWLKRLLNTIYPNIFENELTPKDDECVLDEVKGHDRDYFETRMTSSLETGRKITSENGIGVIVFAHKSTEGWETMLQSVIGAGWILSGSWAIDTERAGRLRSQNSAALASSVHLVCRPRPEGEHVGDWRDVLKALPERIHDWLPRLAKEGIVGADAIFACIGPALEIFSQYSSVEKPNGDVVSLKEYLEHVWAAVSQEALRMVFKEAETQGFEEDARLTAIWLWTIGGGADKANGKAEPEDESDEEEEEGGKSAKVSGSVLEYDTVRKIAQGLGANLDTLKHIVEVKGAKARLLPVRERMKYLFGTAKLQDSAPKKSKKGKQSSLFEEYDQEDVAQDVLVELNLEESGKTILDKVHQCMLLFHTGNTEGLKRFLVEEGVGRDERFWKLAQSLSALYPSGTEEKRWVDGVQMYKKSLGL